MTRTALKIALVLIGGHLLLGVALLVIEATHGINDQDASFGIALVFHYLNLPSIWILASMGMTPEIVVVLVAGIAQWAGVALAIAVVLRVSISTFRAITCRMTQTAQPAGAGDA